MKIKSFVSEPFKSRTLFVALFIIALAIPVFMFLYKIPDDPDLGWHIETGRRIWQDHMIPRGDWYSYTFSQFKWVDHEYLSNVLIYGLTATFGKVSVSIFYTLMAIVTLFVVLKYTTVEKISWPHAALYGAAISPMFLYFVGARPQVVTWLFVASVMAIIATMKRNVKSKAFWLLPPLFLLWANLHGSVFVGLVVYGIYLFVEGMKVFYFWDGKENAFLKRKHSLTTSAFEKLVTTFVASVAATFLNPYGFRIYEEVIRTMTDSYSLSRINEWLSPNFKEATGMLLLIFIIVVIQVMYLSVKNKIDFTYLVFFFVFLFMATQSVRHIPLFVLVVSPFLLESTKRFIDVYLEPVLRQKVVFILIVTTGFLALANFTDFFDRYHASFSETAIAERSNYPEGAVSYIKREDLQGNMFNMYGWGGYLIEKLPERKVFIDGRMPHWREGDLQVFRDYNTIVNVDTLWASKVESYHIDYFLIDRGGALEKTLRQDSGWKEAYSDRTSIIFVRN